MKAALPLERMIYSRVVRELITARSRDVAGSADVASEFGKSNMLGPHSEFVRRSAGMRPFRSWYGQLDRPLKVSGFDQIWSEKKSGTQLLYRSAQPPPHRVELCDLACGVDGMVWGDHALELLTGCDVMIIFWISWESEPP